MHHELEKYIALVQAKSYSKAAQQLHISQPALSIAIQQLEKQLGHKLIQSKRPIILTTAGQEVYESSLRIASEMTQLKDRLSEVSASSKKIALGSIDSIASRLVSHKAYGNLFLLEVNNSARLRHDVLSGALDAAIVTTPHTRLSEHLIITPLAQEPFSLVAHPDIAPNVFQELTKRRVHSFITYNPESTTYKYIVMHANKAGIMLRPKVSSTNPSFILQLVIAKQGCALLPDSLVSSAVSEGTLQALTSTNLAHFNRPVSLIYRNNTDKQSLLSELTQIID